MTDTSASEASVGDLLALVSRVADQARPGEELEVYASRGVETDVRAYDGEIEQLSSAASAGVGIRVVADHRQGFAYAGTLDEKAIVETLAEARDNATYATPDENLGLARPDDVMPAALDLWDEALVSLTTDAKVDMALELERRGAGGGRELASFRAIHLRYQYPAGRPEANRVQTPRGICRCGEGGCGSALPALPRAPAK